MCVFFNVEHYNDLNDDLGTHRIKMSLSIFELMLYKNLKNAREISNKICIFRPENKYRDLRRTELIATNWLKVCSTYFIYVCSCCVCSLAWTEDSYKCSGRPYFNNSVTV